MVEAAGRIREALADGPRTVKELGELGAGFVGNLGLWVDLVRVPPSGTWERRRADRLALADDWVGATDATAAEVMTAFTGSEYFPGGLSGYTIEAGSLKNELGPGGPVRLEWATYADAADQAGQSRLYGGIHIQADDFTGRVIGAQCGRDAWALAQMLFAGTAGG